MQNKNNQNVLEQKFHREFRWNFLGGFFYECIKIIHQIFLLLYLPSSLYGIIGTVFSGIYFATKVADGGASYTLPAFFSRLIKNRKNFSILLLKYFLAPQIPLIIIVSFVILYYYKQILLIQLEIGHFFIIPILIALETLRAFLRYLLHLSFKSKLLVCLELCSFIFYITSIWGGCFIGSWSISLNIVLIAHSIESAIVTIIISMLVYQLYLQQQSNGTSIIENTTLERFWRSRWFNFLLRTGRELFSGNFLTPLIAFKFGFYKTGIFYFVGVLMTSLQSIIKMSIGYTGNALLANVKHDSLEKKKHAFILLSEKIIKIVMPIIVLVSLNGQQLFGLYGAKSSIETSLILSSIFIFIFISEFFVQLYDQFYIIEEASHKLLGIKIMEYGLYYFFIIAPSASSLIDLLLRISIIRMISLGLMTYNAHHTWHIRPSFKTKRKYFLGCLLVGIACFVSFSLMYDSIFHFIQGRV